MFCNYGNPLVAVQSQMTGLSYPVGKGAFCLEVISIRS